MGRCLQSVRRASAAPGPRLMPLRCFKKNKKKKQVEQASAPLPAATSILTDCSCFAAASTRLHGVPYRRALCWAHTACQQVRSCSPAPVSHSPASGPPPPCSPSCRGGGSKCAPAAPAPRFRAPAWHPRSCTVPAGDKPRGVQPRGSWAGGERPKRSGGRRTSVRWEGGFGSGGRLRCSAGRTLEPGRRPAAPMH